MDNTDFVRPYGIDSGFDDKRNAFAQRGDSRGIRSSGLEVHRHVFRLEEVIAANTGSADHQRLQRDVCPNVCAAGSLYSIKGFVACKGEEIDIHFLNVDRDNTCALRSIDDKTNVSFLGNFADGVEVIDRACDIRTMVDKDCRGIVLDCIGDVFGRDTAVLIAINDG